VSLVIHLGVAALGEPGAADEERTWVRLGLDPVDLSVDGPPGGATQACFQIVRQVAQAWIGEAEAPQLRQPLGHGPEAGARCGLPAHEAPQSQLSALRFEA
jgi:hypothetical protein